MSHPFGSDDFYEEYRFGSAAWAQEHELREACLFAPQGPQIGYWDRRALHLSGDSPLICFAGAGSGKLRDLLGFVVCKSPGLRFLALDPRGELGSISIHVHAANGDFAFFWNPLGLCSLPQDRCNPLDILRLDSPYFHSDCKFIAEGLIALSDGTGRYFEQRARSWIEAIKKSRVELNGRTSLPDLYRTINVIESDASAWAAHLETMLASRFEDVRRTAGEMLAKQQDAPREFGAIMGEIYACLSFLDDPVLLAALEEPDFSLEALCDPHQPAKAFLNIPAECLSVWSPLVRLFFTVTMLYKARRPDGPQVMLLVDEAGQAGRFEALLRAFSYGRGAGIRAWAFFQDVGQVTRNFGASALQGFLGSAQLRTFFGVRDYETARLISAMLGSETLHYNDELQQQAAKRAKRQAATEMMSGNDPFSAAFDYAHYSKNEEHRDKQSRQLMTPNEVLALPEDRALHFISGKNLKPVLAFKRPYYESREMAGLYLPNPYHAPLDRVRVATRFGSRWAEIVTEPVPPKLRRFPQHRQETWSYVKGYRPI